MENELIVPSGIVDNPSGEKWLKQICQDLGFKVLVQYRVDNHVPWGGAKIWRWFSDGFVNPKRFGHCTFMACMKLTP